MTIKRVKLKEKSPEFVDENIRKPTLHFCEMPGCRVAGTFRAPKNRGLNEYYWFCEPHIQEYNTAWDFFSGMSPSEIEHHVRQSMFGDRPTWKYTANPNLADNLRTKAHKFRDFRDDTGEARADGHAGARARAIENTPEQEALLIMGLTPPVSLEKIKERYKTLAKAHHPDLNPNDKEAEELLKRVNMAYTILKLAYQRYEQTVAGAK